MVFKDYYKILELKTNKVSSEQIRNAYRIAVKKNHPDLNIEDRLAEEKIKDINEAYKILSDMTAKRKYDRIWTRNNIKSRQQQYRNENKKSNSAFGEVFNMFFGSTENVKPKKSNKTEKTPIKGENIETSIDVDIEEVFYGLDKKISLRTVDGKMKIFTVSIPAGIHNGEKIRLLGQGKEGVDGGKNGDLFIKVNIKDNEKFKLKGNDLYTKLYLTPWEAALGTRTTIYSIDEGTLVYIPEGIESGETLKVSGKGYKDGKGSRGDLIVKVNIMVPKNLSEEEKKLFEKLSTVSSFNPRKA
jgi:curved DNA-binding protein